MKRLMFTVLLLFAGCTVTKPHINEYKISPRAVTTTFSSKACSGKSLKIGQVFSSNTLMSTKMKYGKDEYKEFSFTESEWAQSPNKAISSELVKSVRNSKLFGNVNGFRSRSSSDFILESDAEEFMQYFSENDTKSYARIVTSMTLLDSKTGLVIAEATFKKQVKVQTLDSNGGVKALNEALSDVLSQTNEWLNGVCK